MDQGDRADRADRDVSAPWGSQAPPDEPREPAPVVAEADRYTREGLIGRGGMGVVYLARDRRLDRAVALKEAAHDGATAARLSREATLTAGLDHPGIVTVHDSGTTADGRPFYTMRLVRGRPLSTLLAERATLPDRLALLRHYLDTCNAVGYAHAHGLVHRDLKPANVMVGGFGETQVVDWGLAARVGEPTAPGVGTPTYMSPEQAAGAPADPRADVWSLGVMLAELLGGAVDARRAGPAELWAIADRAVAADPADRYPDAGALAHDVAAWIDGRQVDAHQYTAWELLGRLVRAWRAPLAVGAVASVVLVGLAALSTWRIAEQRDRVTAAQAGTRAALATSDANLAEALVAQARSALVDGSTAVAAVLASHAVALGPAPEAWGVLAATSVSSRATRLQERPLTGCGNPVVVGEDDVLCLGDLGVTRVRSGVADLVLAGPTVAARRIEDSVYLQRAGGTLVRFQPATGPTEGDWQPFRLNGAALWPILPREWDLEALDLPLNRLAERFCPGGAPAAGATRVDARAYAVLCMDGRVGAGTTGELPRVYLPSPVTRESMSGFVAAELTPDGRHLVVGGTKGKVAVIDLQTGAEETTQGGAGAAWLVSVSPDSGFVAIGGDRSDVDVRTLPNLAPVARVPVAALSAKFLADGTLVLATATSLTRWRLPSAPTATSVRGADGVTAALFSPDGRTLATAHGQREATLWDVATGARRASLPIGTLTAKSAAFTLDGSTAWFGITGAGPGSLRPTALRLDGQPAPAIPDDLVRSPVPDVAPGFQSRRTLVLRPGVLVAVGYARDPSLLVLDTTTLARAEIAACPAAEWFDAGQSPAGEFGVLVGDGGQVVRVSHGPDLRCDPAITVEGASSADVDEAGEIAVGTDSSAVVRLDAAGGVRWRVDYPGGRILDVAISDDGRWVAAGGTDHQARLWDETGALRAVLAAHAERVASVDFRPGGRMLVTGSWDGTARLWDLDVLGEDPATLDASAAATWGLSVAQALAAGGR